MALFAILSSCASPKVVVKGYSNEAMTDILKKLEGKSRFEAVRLLGQPAIEGRCKELCGHSDVYRIIYPYKNMSQFYLNIMNNTDVVIDCHVLDFLPDRKLGKFIFSKKHYRTARACNQKDGEILLLDNFRILSK